MAPVFTANWFNFGRNQSAGAAGPPGYVQATGGDAVTSPYPDGSGNTWKTHVFTGSGTFVVSELASNPTNDTCQYLVVGGGGGTGSRWHSGGGGGGGVLVSPGFPGIPTNVHQGPWNGVLTAQTYPVTVGSGQNNANAPGSNNSNPTTPIQPSKISSPTADLVLSYGGGYGGTYQTNGQPGGSGGGAGAGGPAEQGVGSNPGQSSQQGYPGGAGGGPSSGGCGGGGGGAAYQGREGHTGHGGIGRVVNIFATPTSEQTYGGTQPGNPAPIKGCFAGGGGGSNEGIGASTGGGMFGPGSPGIDPGWNHAGAGGSNEDGDANTGGGAGAPSNNTGSGNAGGSGIVAIRYKVG